MKGITVVDGVRIASFLLVTFGGPALKTVGFALGIVVGGGGK
jgi:hypothetical protein